jgi:hypothetical protein
MSPPKVVMGALLALLLLSLSQGAPAAMLPATSASAAASSASLFTLSGDTPGSRLVLGSSATVTTIHVNTAGTLSFTLIDESFSDALGSLSFALTNASGALTTMSGPGTLSWDVAGPVTLYADVFASAQGTANVGLYNLQLSFAPLVAVPLPMSGLLLGAALMILWRLKVRPIWPQRHNCHTAVA